MVSATASSSGPPSRQARADVEHPLGAGPAPSKGQPNAAARMTVVRSPASRAAGGDVEPRRDLAGGVDALVAQGEPVGGDDHDGDLVAAGGDGAVEAAPVEDQPDRAQPRVADDLGEHGLGVGHLRHQVGPREGGHLDPPEPGVQAAADQLDLGLGGQQPGLVLQPVARGHLDDLA